MMKINLFQIDAFTSKRFGGNPAAVCPLENWLDDSLLQAIAAENNLSETAFFVHKDDHFELRWFTPVTEVDLCGHATLASSYVLFNELGYNQPVIHFNSKSGPLAVSRDGDLIVMDFPAFKAEPFEPPSGLIEGLGQEPGECYRTDDYLLIYDSEQLIRDITPDFHKLKSLDNRGIIVSAPGERVDFVSRFFAPNIGIDEDPVTGSAHSTLAPFWAGRLGKNELQARQISRRGGEIFCEVQGKRVKIKGRAVKYLSGTISI